MPMINKSDATGNNRYGKEEMMKLEKSDRLFVKNRSSDNSYYARDNNINRYKNIMMTLDSNDVGK